MLMLRPARSFLAASALVAGLWSSTALAGPREDFLAALEASWKAVGASEIKIGAVTGDDNRLEISEVTGKMKVDDETVDFAIGPSSVVNARANADQSYTIGEMISSNFVIKGDKLKVVLKSVSFVNYASPPPAELKAIFDKTQQVRASYDSISGNGVSVIEGDEEDKFSIEAFQITASGWKNFLPRSATGSIKGITPQLDDSARKDLGDLGYGSVKIDIDTAANWDDVKGTLAVDRFDVGLRDMATLKFSAVVSGMTEAVYSELSTLDTKDESSQARVLEILQSLTIDKAQLRLENGSLVDKILDKQAKDAGANRAEFVGNLMTMMPMVLATLKNKPLEKEIAVAVRSFLQMPKSLSVALEPKEPVSFAQIIGSASLAPQTLPALLSAKVKAND